jgi:hypothetical protein
MLTKGEMVHLSISVISDNAIYQVDRHQDLVELHEGEGELIEFINSITY